MFYNSTEKEYSMVCRVNDFGNQSIFYFLHIHFSPTTHTQNKTKRSQGSNKQQCLKDSPLGVLARERAQWG